MKYTLITKTGKIYTFFLESVAQTFQLAYGGTLITEEIYATAYATLLSDVE